MPRFSFSMLSRWAAVICLLAGAAYASPLEYTPLTAQRMDRLNKDSRHEYELALAALDKVNYELALDHFTKAVNAEQDNPWLRFSIVQIAIYLGDSRSGAESIKYYDMAAQNLKSISESPKLNARERQRAQQWEQNVSELRQSVLERDAKRVQYGREIAKQYAKEVFQDNKDQGKNGADKTNGKPGEKNKNGGKEGEKPGAAPGAGASGGVQSGR